MQSKQEAFETVVRGLYAQGGPSFDDLHHGPGICKYRGAEGRKCAVGHLIPDEKYVPELECNIVDNFSPEFLDTFAFNLEELQELQHAHDLESTCIAEALNSFAEKHYLVWPPEVPTFGWGWPS